MPKETAETMSARQKDISVAEFFAKNKHLLGFDNPRKALLTAVKEAVDNSLDACEEASILPNILVVIEDLVPGSAASNPHRFRVTVVDNGPGIVRKNIENVFGRLLFGSKFHRLKMSRGQQGIGISAAGMYGLITTGKPMGIHTRIKKGGMVVALELAINTKSNRAEVYREEGRADIPFPPTLSAVPVAYRHPKDFPTGTSVSIELEGIYRKGKGSVDEFLELVGIANPHAHITFVWPSRYYGGNSDESGVAESDATTERSGDSDNDGPGVEGIDTSIQTTTCGNITIFPRSVRELPKETVEIQPHPNGIELGTLLQMTKNAQLEDKNETLHKFLHTRFCCIDEDLADAFVDAIKLPRRVGLSALTHDNIQLLYKTFRAADLDTPPTDCLSPIGVRQMLSGLLKGLKAEFYAASSRPPTVYRGRPFQIEAGIAFGGEIDASDECRLLRLANRVPLQNLASSCCTTKATVEVNWKAYGLPQGKSCLPGGQVVIMLHMASVWVPFTSESKEAIADYDEIREEMKLALMECGRKLGIYMKKRASLLKERERRDVFKRYLGEVSKAVASVSGCNQTKLYKALFAQAEKKTALADASIDDAGNIVRRQHAALQRDDSVVVVEDRATVQVEENNKE
jgi:DNA topoisomerase VI subunit B